jgi:hypothetical protein
MSHPRWSLHARALLAYCAVTLLFNWPLPLHLSSQLTGRITGDTGVYVWNVWLFRHEILANHRFPLFTQEILSLRPPIDLSLHNYTLFANVLAFPLIPHLGVTATFNVVYLTLTVLTAWAMFVLARRVIGRTAEAWLVGLMFGFSPFLIARSEAHFSLVAAAPLPIFMLVLMRATRHLRLRDAALAGVVVAWASMCDPYYGIFCLLLAACYLVVRHVRIQPASAPPARTAWLRVVDVCALMLISLIAFVLATGGGEWAWLGVRVAIKSLYTPVLVLTVLVLLRIALAARPSVMVEELPPLRVALKMIGTAGAVCTLLLSPVLFALRHQMASGGELHGPVYWRNSPSGVDLLALFSPNPNHPLFGTPWRQWLTDEPGGYVENAASLTIVGLAIVAIAVWRYRFRAPRAWSVLTLFFAALAAGPFLHVAGANTFIPGPWALLRYVPIISATRTPARFAIVAMMAFSMLFGLALARIARTHPAHRRLLLAVVGLLLAFELSPWPRRTYSAMVPEIYARIANDKRDVRVLELPTGIRDGEWSEGNFNASTQFYQTFHQKKLYGGYLSRIPRIEVERQLFESQTIAGLIRLSAGDTLRPRPLKELTGRGPGFVERTKLGYVVINARRTPTALREFAVDAFGLVKVGEHDGAELYVPCIKARATTALAALSSPGRPALTGIAARPSAAHTPEPGQTRSARRVPRRARDAVRRIS